MRKRIQLMTMALAAYGLPALAQAGVYSSVEPKWELSADYFRKFQENSLTPLKQLGTPNATEPWQKYCELVANERLVAKDPPIGSQEDKMTIQERLDLAVCLLRVRYPGKQMPEKAIEQLKAIYSRDKSNFLIMSTLATAYQITGDYQHADDWLGEAGRSGRSHSGS